MDDILNQGASTGGADVGSEMPMLKHVNRAPTLKEQLTREIEATKARLAAMEAALEVIDNAPQLEVLQQGMAALRRNY